MLSASVVASNTRIIIFWKITCDYSAPTPVRHNNLKSAFSATNTRMALYRKRMESRLLSCTDLRQQKRVEHVGIDFRGYRLLPKLRNIVLASNPLGMESTKAIRHSAVGRETLYRSVGYKRVRNARIELESNQWGNFEVNSDARSIAPYTSPSYNSYSEQRHKSCCEAKLRFTVNVSINLRTQR